MLKRTRNWVSRTAAILFVATSPIIAQTVSSNPDPGITGEGFVTYTGRFGEVLKLRGGWTIVSPAHGDSEIVRQYPPFRIDIPDSVDKFNPVDADFIPENFENFTTYALIELRIEPRTQAADKVLGEEKRRIVDFLTASEAQFKVIENPAFGGWVGQWPAGTFEIRVASPYRLTRLYTAASGRLVVLTAGLDSPPSTVINAHYDSMRIGVRDWIASQTTVAEERPARKSPEPASLAGEVLDHLKSRPEFRELIALRDAHKTDDRWLQSDKGRHTTGKIERMLDDAASVRIAKEGPTRVLVYAIRGSVVTERGILIGDLESDKSYREFIVDAIATSISSASEDPLPEQQASRRDPPDFPRSHASAERRAAAIIPKMESGIQPAAFWEATPK